MIKWSIYQEDETIVKLVATNNTLLKYMKQKLTKNEDRNRQQDNNSWRLQHLTFHNGQNNEEENQEDRKLDQHYKPTRPNRLLKHCRIYIYCRTLYPKTAEYTFSSAHEILQDQSYVRSQNKPQNI